MTPQRLIGEQHEVLRRVPLVPQISPHPTAQRCNIGRLPDQHSSGRQDLPNRFQNTPNIRNMFDNVKEMNGANAAWSDMPS
jgi:hypothetical protein